MLRSQLIAILLLTQSSFAVGQDIRLNQLQVIGTHNSYHIEPHPAIMETLNKLKPDAAKSLEYGQPPMATQLGEFGIRQMEWDIFADPKGGHYSKPYFRQALLDQKKDVGPDPNTDGILDQPGFKIFHIQDFDYRSQFPTLQIALKQLREWSQAHPKHVPIFILLELKDDVNPLLPTKPVPFTPALLVALEKEIAAVFDAQEVFRPDDLRQEEKDLPTAIQKHGWPKVEDVRGKVMFCLDNENKHRDEYVKIHPGLKEAWIFTSMAKETAPEAAWFKINNPIKDFAKIQKLVKAGFMVRTRADSETKQARKNDSKQRDQALASGAQMVSTDYPVARKEWSEYRVSLPQNAVARINPVNGPKRLKVIDVEVGK